MVAAALLLSVMSLAAAKNELPPLEVFGPRGIPPGLWKMELLENSSMSPEQSAKAMSGLAICMDAATEMNKRLQPDRSGCKQRITENTRTRARLELRCPDGSVTTTVIQRESARSFLMHASLVMKNGSRQTTKIRYSYAGECNPDQGLMRAEKDSEMCRRVLAGAAAMDPDSSCAGMPADQKAGCRQQVQLSIESARKMCGAPQQ